MVGALVYALASLGLFGVAMPIIAMRQQGILRLMRTTPVTRLTFVLAQVPARLILGMALTLCALLAAWALWDVTLPQLAAALGTSVLGFWMSAAFGYLVGGLGGRHGWW
nr:ABC transporter permease [Symbiobacterium thermophilum]